MKTRKLTKRELDTILAALRFWQEDAIQEDSSDPHGFAIPADFADIALEHGNALSSKEVDALCQDLNMGMVRL